MKFPPVRSRSSSASHPSHHPRDDVSCLGQLGNQESASTPDDAHLPPSLGSTGSVSSPAVKNGTGDTSLPSSLYTYGTQGTNVLTPKVTVPTNGRVARLFETPREAPPKYVVKMVCQQNLNFMNTFPANSIKLIVTSPPYNIGKRYETPQSLETYIEEQRRVVAECIRLLHPSGSICWQVGNYINNGEVFPLDILFYDIFKDAGLKLRNRIIWKFDHGLHCKKRLSGRYETILWFTKGDEYTFRLDPIRIPQKYPQKKHHKGPNYGKPSCNPLGKNPGDVWTIPNVKHNHVEKTSHPCQFPVELVERLVLSLTECGDNVLDPYMGVGTTVIAAVKHSRNGFGCDIVSDYVDTAWKRFHALQEGRIRIRPMNRPIYEPPST